MTLSSYQLLNDLFSHRRTRSHHANTGSRTHYQIDYDRIIFSSSFRRLQNKTQVFPLPGSVFVHNRLTHSLEVASVGRSIGYEIGQFIVKNHKSSLNDESAFFYEHGLQHVIASACLAHDIGNPAFGHSGEDAIAYYFVKNEDRLKSHFSENEWTDLIHFEGNANAIRILTHGQNGKSEGGLDLTYSTLSAIAKYPCESSARNKQFLHRKKFGFFQSEKNVFMDLTRECSFIAESNNPIIFKRHPFVWLTEIADDICYNIIDLEDAHRLGLVHSDKVEYLLVHVASDLFPKRLEYKERLKNIIDENERIGFLRAICINRLIKKSIEIYIDRFDEVLNGSLGQGIFDIIYEQNPSLKEIKEISIKKIYNNRSVLQIENAGYNVMYELLEHFMSPVLKSNPDAADKMALKLIPSQFKYKDSSSYTKALGIIDFISGMTDNYATDLYRKIKGIDMGMSF